MIIFNAGISSTAINAFVQKPTVIVRFPTFLQLQRLICSGRRLSLPHLWLVSNCPVPPLGSKLGFPSPFW